MSKHGMQYHVWIKWLDCLQYLALNFRNDQPDLWAWSTTNTQFLAAPGSGFRPYPNMAVSVALLQQGSSVGWWLAGQTWRSVCTPHRQWMSMVLNVQPRELVSWKDWASAECQKSCDWNCLKTKSHILGWRWRKSRRGWTSSIRSCKDSKLIKRIQKLTRDVYEIHKMWKQEMQSQTNFTGAPLSASRSTLRLSAELCSHGPLRATHAHSLKSPTSKQVPLRAFGIDWWAAINGGVIHCHNPFPVPWKAPTRPLTVTCKRTVGRWPCTHVDVPHFARYPLPLAFCRETNRHAVLECNWNGLPWQVRPVLHLLV